MKPLPKRNDWRPALAFLLPNFLGFAVFSAAPIVFSYIAGLGGRDVTPEAIDAIVANTASADQPDADTLWVGLKE